MKAMKSMVLCFFLLCGATILEAQAPEWQWAVSTGGTESDEGQCTAIDSQGNQYVAGSFSGTAYFDTYTLSSTEGLDIFVVKLDSFGTLLWAVKAGATGNDQVQSISIDGSDNAYISGYFDGTATFGTWTINSYGWSDVFVAKLDSAGNWHWAVNAGGPDSDLCFDISVDNSGNSYTTGFFQNTATFGPYTLSTGLYSNQQIFVAKIDPAGNWLWAVKAGGNSYASGNGISVDNANNAYLTGSFYGGTYFGSIPLSTNGQTDIFVAKIDPAGNWLWAVKAGGTNWDEGLDTAIDSEGNTLVTGRFQGTAAFGGYIITSNGDSDIFAAKIDSLGNWLWVVKAGGSNWDDGRAIVVDNTGNLYLTGCFREIATFGSHMLTAGGLYDIFAAKLDPAGNFIWVTKAGGAGDDRGYSIALDGGGNAFLTGSFQDVANFGSHNLSSTGSFDVYAAKLPAPTPFAAFSADMLSGPHPLMVQFADHSIAGAYPIVDWLWSFGDGGSSTQQNPLHAYTTPGIYTISLTVIDQNYQISANVRPNYITVIERIYIVEMLSPENLSFGSVYLEEQSGCQGITFSNTGNVDLSFSETFFANGGVNFELSEPFSSLDLPPGVQTTLNVRFAPHQVGAVSDTLVIVNNSANQPILKIRLKGTGEYVPLAVPQNVQVAINSHDAVITWDPVMQNLHGQLVTPDLYVVLYSEWPYENNELIYYYLTSTTGLSALHYNVALFRDNMFYKVKAVKFYRGDLPPAALDSWLEDNLRPGMCEAEVWRSLNELTHN